eukprot:14413374-Ditylum_brightwellii.AAC.1
MARCEHGVPKSNRHYPHLELPNFASLPALVAHYDPVFKCQALPFPEGGIPLVLQLRLAEGSSPWLLEGALY